MAELVELLKGQDGFAVVSEVLGVFVLVIDGVDAEIEGFSNDGLKKDEKRLNRDLERDSRSFR